MESLSRDMSSPQPRPPRRLPQSFEDGCPGPLGGSRKQSPKYGTLYCDLVFSRHPRGSSF